MADRKREGRRLSRALELVSVPFEVERRDSAMAAAPRRLLDGGFAARLAERGFEVRPREVTAPRGGDRGATVAAFLAGTARAVAEARAAGRMPLILSGGCLTATGVVAGLEADGEDEVELLWLDAHGDFNTPETSPSGYWDGMALAVVCGRCHPELGAATGLRPLAPERVVHLGGRDLDPPEVEAFDRFGVRCVPPGEVAAFAAAEARHPSRSGPLYLHVDLDALDPAVAPAVAFPVPGGIGEGELAPLLASLDPAALTLSALSFADADRGQIERTVRAAVDLVTRALDGA